LDLNEISKLTVSLYESICTFCFVNGIKIEKILDTNIAKLKARYGDKFSSEKAIKRNLELERTILEQ
jgi:hypothetical protein